VELNIYPIAIKNPLWQTNPSR